MSDVKPNYEQLAQQIKLWGQQLGFSEVGITDIDLTKHEAQLQRWLDAGDHSSMDYMAAHGMKRARPSEYYYIANLATKDYRLDNSDW